jgi:hypothetical protein
LSYERYGVLEVENIYVSENEMEKNKFPVSFHGQKCLSLVLDDQLLPLDYRLLSLETGYKLIVDRLIEKIKRLQVLVLIEALLVY